MNYSLKQGLDNAESIIEISDGDDILTCRIKNRLSKKTDIAEIKRVLKAKSTIITSAYFDPALRTEGNTGIIKASNILKNILRCEANELNVLVEDEKYFIVSMSICLGGLKL